MESTEVLSLLEQLDDEIDDLEDSLVPVLKTPLSITSSKLPVLDKAKLYVLTTYAIESLLFSYLKLNGVNAREHAVFRELTRVKQYFVKIKAAETPAARPLANLDKEAAKRFVKAGLAGNDRNGLGRTKAKGGRSHIKFNDAAEEQSKNLLDSSSHITDTSDGSSLGSVVKGDDLMQPAALQKKRTADLMHDSGLVSSSSCNSGSEVSRKKQRKSNKR